MIMMTGQLLIQLDPIWLQIMVYIRVTIYTNLKKKWSHAMELFIKF